MQHQPLSISTRPRRHSVVTLKLTVTPDDVFNCDAKSPGGESPTLTPRYRSHHRHHRKINSPLCRTPTSPLCGTPTSPHGSRVPTSPRTRTPTSPRERVTPSPVLEDDIDSPPAISPRSGGRHFRYDNPQEHPSNLRRRSSLLTVPSVHDSLPDHLLRTPRQRSSSIAGPLRTPDLLR